MVNCKASMLDPTLDHIHQAPGSATCYAVTRISIENSRSFTHMTDDKYTCMYTRVYTRVTGQHILNNNYREFRSHFFLQIISTRQSITLNCHTLSIAALSKTVWWLRDNVDEVTLVCTGMFTNSRPKIDGFYWVDRGSTWHNQTLML